MAGISYEIGAIVTLKDMTASVWTKLQKQQDDFKKSIKETKKDLESAFSGSISIKLDTSSFMSSINEVKNQVNNIQSTSVEVNVHINKKEEEAPKAKSKTREEIDEKKKELKQALSEKFPFKVDNSPFLSSIRDAKKELDKLKQEKIELKAKMKLEKQQRDERRNEIKLAFRDDSVNKSKQEITKFISSLKNKNSKPSVKNTEVSGKEKIKSLGKKAITAVKENKPYYMTLALKDMASQKIKLITAKPKAMTVSAVAKTASALSGVKALASTVKKPFVAAIAVKELVTGKVKEIKSSLSELGKKVFSPVIQIKDNIAGAVGKVGTFAKGAIGAGIQAGKVLADVGISMMTSGAELEQQQIFMKQAMGENNKGKSDSELSSMSANYMKDIRDSGASNGFQSKDIVQAGTKALGIAGGDTSEAMNLVKMAQDMAALNPGKSAEDAMEALEELKSGGTSKLKDFNMDVSEGDAKNLGLKGVMDQKLKPKFAGGAEKMGQTGTGLVSTIKEKVKNRTQDIGLNMLEKMKPVLSGIVKILDSPGFANFSSKLGDGITFVFGKIGEFATFIQGKMPQIQGFIGGAMQFIGDKFSWIGEKMPSLQQILETGWNVIANVFTTVQPLIEPLLSILINGVRLIYEGFQLAFPYIQEIVTSVWENVQPIFEALSNGLSWVADKFGKLLDWIGGGSSSSDSGSSGGGRNVDGSHANGLKNVPFDGYIAELHKGEAVIPASQNPYNSSTSYSTGGSVVFTKLADQIVVREEADIDRIADKLVKQLQKTSFNKA
ncbi:hypothetical protein [Clostridium intestinale]|uniref:Uncharacterized protein n=1 Tax=Clostridium intestinale DSM 6191 TaxID=1121320 RepID=A0A1M6DYZ1_9CLOT|nr:hypothetical protein [Clostridium intestinale]SHI78350.1 hypothetical protein SAMN02745941_04332 [Clostridium intestinale DSM 6191]